MIVFESIYCILYLYRVLKLNLLSCIILCWDISFYDRKQGRKQGRKHGRKQGRKQEGRQEGKQEGKQGRKQKEEASNQAMTRSLREESKQADAFNPRLEGKGGSRRAH